MAQRINRRQFVKGTAAASLGFWVAGRGAWAAGDAPAVVTSANEKLNVGFIGTTHQANYDLHQTNDSGLVNVVALCDIDGEVLDKMGKKYPKAKKYFDYRKMLEELGDKIDHRLLICLTLAHPVFPAGELLLRRDISVDEGGESIG